MVTGEHALQGTFKTLILSGWVWGEDMQGMARIFTTQHSPPSRHLYSQLLLQDFNKDFMLISKHTESCRLNIVSWLAAGAVAVAVATGAAATILWLWLPAAVLLPLSGGRVLAHCAAASLPCSLAVTHSYSGSAARCR